MGWVGREGNGRRPSRPLLLPSPRPEGGKCERGLTRLMGIQVLTGDVVINHIFLQGGESEPVNWE